MIVGCLDEDGWSLNLASITSTTTDSSGNAVAGFGVGSILMLRPEIFSLERRVYPIDRRQFRNSNVLVESEKSYKNFPQTEQFVGSESARDPERRKRGRMSIYTKNADPIVKNFGNDTGSSDPHSHANTIP